MKSIADVKKELAEYIELIKDTKKEKPKRAKSMEKKLSTYKNAILYLETDPTEAFVKQEIKTVMHKISAVRARFVLPANVGTGEIAKLRKTFEASYEVPKMQKHLTMLKFFIK